MKKAHVLLLAAMLVYPAAAHTQDKVLLARKAKVGDVTRMSMEGTLAGNLAGQPASLEMKGVDTTTVTAVSSDGGLTFQQLAESLELSINGLVMSGLPIPPADTIVMRSTRALTSYTSGDGDFEAAAFERKMYNATTVVAASSSRNVFLENKPARFPQPFRDSSGCRGRARV